MAVQVALVDSNGDIVTVMTPGTDDMYQNGIIYGDYVAWHIDVNTDAADFIDTKYYDFDLNDFVTRNIRPSNFHVWNKDSKSWSFNQIKAMDWVRVERGRLLTYCDWTQLPDCPLTAEEKEAWQVYRQALRNLPETLGVLESMDDVVWPTPPGA